MLADERRQSVLEMIQENGSARTADLAAHFGVSSQTIRRDLMMLEARGHINKGYGGGVLIPYQGSPYLERSVQRRREKSLIARAALEHIKGGMTVALGPGTTTEMLAHLMNGKDVHVITNSLPVTRAIHHPDTAVSLLGGRYRPDSDLVTGAWTALTLSDLFADVGFIGVSGVAQEAGYTVTEPDEAAVLKQILRASKHAVVVVDSSKFLRVAKETVAPLSAVHRLITDSDVTPEHLAWLKAAALEVEVITDVNQPATGEAADPALPRNASTSGQPLGGLRPGQRRLAQL